MVLGGGNNVTDKENGRQYEVAHGKSAVPDESGGAR